MYKADEKRYDKMKYLRCGKSGLFLPRVSLGLWHNFGSVDKFENMLDMVVVLLLVIYFYIYQIRRVVLTYKDAGGIWWEDRYRPYISMAVNLIGNYIMVQIIGIYGVILSTIFSMLVSIPMENYTVFKYIFRRSPVKFYLKNFVYVLLATVLCTVTYMLCSFAPEGFPGLLMRGGICLTVPNCIILLLFHRTEEFNHARKLLFRR